MNINPEIFFTERAQYALEQAKKAGAKQARVILLQEDGQTLTRRDGEIEKLNREQDFSISVSLIAENGAKGVASGSDSSFGAICQMVKAAVDIANFAEADEYFGLPEYAWYQTGEKIISIEEKIQCDVDEEFSTDDLNTQAAEAEDSARGCDGKINNVESSAYGGSSYFLTADSQGFSYGKKRSYRGLSVSLIASKNDEKQSAWYGKSTLLASQLPKAELIGKKAAKRALNALSPQKITGGTFPVLFVPEMAASLVDHIISALGGVMQYRKLSYLHDSIGEMIMPQWLNIREHPFLPQMLRSAACDKEGIPTSDNYIIGEGRVYRYLLSSYSARRLGMMPTGNASGVRNLSLEAHGRASFSREELCRQMGNGLIVTDLMGQGVNLLTGDYSRGASGFWVENGVIKHPVEGITIASNLREMCERITAIGIDVDNLSNYRVPSILIDAMTIAT